MSLSQYINIFRFQSTMTSMTFQTYTNIQYSCIFKKILNNIIYCVYKTYELKIWNNVSALRLMCYKKLFEKNIPVK